RLRRRDEGRDQLEVAGPPALRTQPARALRQAGELVRTELPRHPALAEPGSASQRRGRVAPDPERRPRALRDPRRHHDVAERDRIAVEAGDVLLPRRGDRSHVLVADAASALTVRDGRPATQLTVTASDT